MSDPDLSGEHLSIGIWRAEGFNGAPDDVVVDAFGKLGHPVLGLELRDRAPDTHQVVPPYRTQLDRYGSNIVDMLVVLSCGDDDGADEQRTRTMRRGKPAIVAFQQTHPEQERPDGDWAENELTTFVAFESPEQLVRVVAEHLEAIRAQRAAAGYGQSNPQSGQMFHRF